MKKSLFSLLVLATSLSAFAYPELPMLVSPDNFVQVTVQGKDHIECQMLMDMMEKKLEKANKVIILLETCNEPGDKSASIRYLKY